MEPIAKPMSCRPLSREEVREVDRRAIEEYGMTGAMLMENAGRGSAELLCELGCRGPVMIVCGAGNNGGDGFVIARHLDLRGIEVRLALLAAPAQLHGDAALNYNVVARSGIAILDFSQQFDEAAFEVALACAEWIVDALLGTGARGSPRPPQDRAIRAMNRAAATRLAIDLPSGLDCDTGQPAEPTFRANHTATFVAPKTGFAAASAQQYLGRVHVIDIGAPRRLLKEIDAAGKEP